MSNALELIVQWWSLETLLAAVLYVRVWRPWLLRRSVWGWVKGFDNQETGILVDMVRSDATSQYIRPAVGLGAASSIGEISTSLAATRMRLFARSRHQSSNPFRVYFVGDALAEHALRSGNNVVLGGPKTNVLTAEIIQHLSTMTGMSTVSANIGSGSRFKFQSKLELKEKEFKFEVEGSTITICDRSFTGNVEYRSNIPNSEGIRLDAYSGTDYGFVLRLPSLAMSARSGLRMVVLFGSQTFGVVGATSWLVDSPTVGLKPHAVNSFLRKNLNVICVVKVQIHHGMVRSCELVELVRVPV